MAKELTAGVKRKTKEECLDIASRLRSSVVAKVLDTDDKKIRKPWRILEGINFIADSFDWSGTGRGLHVELHNKDELPLRIGEQVGRGATSDVHEAWCKGLRVAVKRRKVYRKSDEDLFRQEMKKLKRVSGHDHVVKIVGSFIHNRVIGILLWPVAQSDLATFLYDFDALCDVTVGPGFAFQESIVDLIGSDGYNRLIMLNALCHINGTDDTFPKDPHNKLCDLTAGFKRLFRLLGCISGALAYIHNQRIKHKDLKPTNILLTQNSVLLTDFGTSTDFSESTVSTTDGNLRGSPRYFAPEVADYQPSGRAADIFSLGCVFVETAFVSRQLRLEKLRQLLPNRDRSYQANLEHSDAWLDNLNNVETLPHGGMLYPQAFFDLVKRMLSNSPQRRPQACQVVTELYDMRLQISRKSRNSDTAFFCSNCFQSAARSSQNVEDNTPAAEVEVD